MQANPPTDPREAHWSPPQPDGDSDGDGFTDAQEMEAGSDPFDPDSVPPPPANDGGGSGAGGGGAGAEVPDPFTTPVVTDGSPYVVLVRSVSAAARTDYGDNSYLEFEWSDETGWETRDVTFEYGEGTEAGGTVTHWPSGTMLQVATERQARAALPYLSGDSWGVTGLGGTERAFSSVTWEEGGTKPDENPPDFASGVRFERRWYGGSTKTWTAEIKQVCLAWTNAASTASMRFPVSIPYVLEHLINGIIVDTVKGELTLEPGFEHSGVVTLAADVQNGGTEEYVLRLMHTDVDLAIPTEVEPPVLAAVGNDWMVSSSEVQQVDLNVGAVLVAEDKEDTEGGWVVLNFDDDDGRGNYSDGNTSAISDLDYTGAITRANDMIRVGIKKLEMGTQQVSYRFKFSSTNIRLWKKKDRSEAVISEQTEFSIPSNMNYAVAHIEGIKPHDDDEGTKITGQVKIGSGQWIDAETVKVRVARPIVCVWGDLDDWLEDKKNLAKYLVAQTGNDPTRQRNIFSTGGNTLGESFTFLVAGRNSNDKNVCYSVTGIGGGASGERAFKLSLKTEGVDITATGHANYGVGLAFGKNFTEYNQFFNMAAGGTTAVAWNAFGNHPYFSVLDPRGLTSPELYRPYAIARLNNVAVANPTNRMLQGIPVPNVDRFPHLDEPRVALNGAFTTHTGSTGPNCGKLFNNLDANTGQEIIAGYLTWHFLEDGKLIGGEEEEVPSVNTIINCGKQDVPLQLKYRSLLLNSCNGLRNFAESFKHGNVFAPWESVAPEIYSREYVRALVDGLDWDEITEVLNEVAEPEHPSNTSVGRKLYARLSY